MIGKYITFLRNKQTMTYYIAGKLNRLQVFRYTGTSILYAKLDNASTHIKLFIPELLTRIVI